MSPDFFVEDLEDYQDIWVPYMRNNNLPPPDVSHVLGCGSFGCVFGTETPEVAIKLTTAFEEAELMELQLSASLIGIVRVFGFVELDRKLWLIWREKLDLCCDEAVRRMYMVHRPDMEYATYLDKVTKVVDFWRNAGEVETDIPGVRDIVQAYEELKESYDRILDDVSVENIGCFLNYDQLVLFDGMI